MTAFGLRDSSFEQCEIAHVGSHAIRLDEGCQDNKIVQCHIDDCGGGAIYVGPDAKVGYMPPSDDLKVQRNVIENNFIHHTSRVLGGSIGVWVGSSSFNKIRHNEISDFDYTGISVGWCWRRETDILQRENIIEYNHVHHPDTPKTYSVTVGSKDGEIKTASDVVFVSDQFATCIWFGISSLDNDKAIYYLDNIEMTIDDTIVRN